MGERAGVRGASRCVGHWLAPSRPRIATLAVNSAKMAQCLIISRPRYRPTLLCMMPPSAKMVVAVR